MCNMGCNILSHYVGTTQFWSSFVLNGQAQKKTSIFKYRYIDSWQILLMINFGYCKELYKNKFYGMYTLL